MHSKNNKCSSLPSSYLLFLFSSQSHFSCLFSQYPLILSFLILCSLFYRLSTSSSLFLTSCHALFPRALYLFACRCFILFRFSPSSLLLYFLLSVFYCFPQFFPDGRMFFIIFYFLYYFLFFRCFSEDYLCFLLSFFLCFSFSAPIISKLVLFSLCSLQP